jgi:hypothetical protein
MNLYFYGTLFWVLNVITLTTGIMKNRIVIGGLMIALISTQVLAQVENDDMYFRAKDREKLKAENASISVNGKIDNDYKAFKQKHFDEGEEVAETGNPTDSYSARNVNPEYIARSNSEQASEAEQTYYLEGYTPPNTFDSYSSGYNNTYPNNLNSGFGYQNGWYNPSMYNNSMYSPYYGYCDPWMSPYYSQPGWTMSLSYTWGSMWGSGYGYGMGYGNSYNPYYGYGYSPYYSNYPTYYSESSRTNYGKRPSRHSVVVTPTKRTEVADNDRNTNGRTRQQDEYYVRPSRRTTTYSNSSEYNRPTTDYSRSRTRTSFDSNSDSRQSRPSYTPSRSSSSTPSRSSSTPSRSSSSSSSRSRGGN